MFEIGWSELFVIAAVALVVIGPDEIPQIMRMMARIVRRLQYVRFAFSQQFDDLMKEAGMEDIRKQVNFEEKNFDESASDEEENIATEKSKASEN